MFYNNFVNFCNAVDKSPSAVVLEIGLQKSTVTRWKKGSVPTDATLQKVADYFGVHPSDLLSELVTCKDCGFSYSPAVLSDIKAHLKQHKKYMEVKRKFNFWNDKERKYRHEYSEYEKDTTNPFDKRLEAAKKIIFAYFSRSVESNCDLSHITFEEYIPYFLHSQKHLFEPDVRNALISHYGEKEGMEGSYWQSSLQKKSLLDKIKKPVLKKDEPEITFDDFTYAFLDESKELTEENKQKLLEMAKFFKQQQEKEN